MTPVSIVFYIDPDDPYSFPTLHLVKRNAKITATARTLIYLIISCPVAKPAPKTVHTKSAASLIIRALLPYKEKLAQANFEESPL